jgi:hypothetical protein
MASGDLTASTPVYCSSIAEVKTAIDALNLATTTDFIKVVAVPGRENTWIVFKVEREA